jgi:RNA polymerase sigma factor (sigma-70 family)
MSANLRSLFQRIRTTHSIRPVSERGDGELVEAFAETRDDEAFAELVRRHGPMVLAACRRVLHPDLNTADDAFQATFLVLVTKAAAVRPPDQVGAWLYGVAVHVAKRARAWVQKIARSSSAGLDEVPATSNEPDLDATHRRSMIDAVLACLPMKYRTPVVLCDLEGKSRAEAAAALGWSEGTLSGRLSRARKLLAERLARRGVAVPAVGGVVGLLAQPAMAVVPSHLAASTIQAAALLAAGAATTEVVSESVAAFTRGGCPSMTTTTFKFLVAGFVCAGLALCGFSLLTPHAAAKPKLSPIVMAVPQVRFVAEDKVVQAKGWVSKYTFTHKAPITAVAFGPALIITADQKGSLIMWNAKTGKEQEVLNDGTRDGLKGFDRLQVSSDGAWLYMTGDEGHDISQCSVAKEKRVFPGVSSVNWKCYGIMVDGDCWLLTLGDHKTLHLRENKIADNIIVGAFNKSLFEHKDAIEFAAAGDHNVIATIAGGVLRRWETGNAKPTWEEALDKLEPTRLVIGGDGETIAVTGKSGEVRLFSVKTGKVTGKLSAHKGPVYAVAFSPDGKQIVTGGEDKTVRMWDAESGKEIAKLEGHTGTITGAAFSPEGEMIATGSEDKTVKVWEFKK